MKQAMKQPTSQDTPHSTHISARMPRSRQRPLQSNVAGSGTETQTRGTSKSGKTHIGMEQEHTIAARSETAALEQRRLALVHRQVAAAAPAQAQTQAQAAQ